jgi:hypothetical protein
MPRRKKITISLEEAKSRFEEWRRNRQGKAAIPDELWVAAAEVARHEGVSRTSTELRVEWNELKRRMAVPEPLPGPVPPPAFLELVAPGTQSHPECTVELEGRRGKLRIQLKDASATYLAKLSRELWESAS